MMTEYGDFDTLPPEVQEVWLANEATDKLMVAIHTGAVSREALVGWATTVGSISMVVVEVRWVMGHPVPLWSRGFPTA